MIILHLLLNYNENFEHLVLVLEDFRTRPDVTYVLPHAGLSFICCETQQLTFFRGTSGTPKPISPVRAIFLAVLTANSLRSICISVFAASSNNILYLLYG